MNENFSFEQLPQMVGLLIEKVERLEKLMSGSTQEKTTVGTDRWLSLIQLREYLPEHPAAATVYGWVSERKIPFSKGSKALRFRKSEIDKWIEQGKRKDVAQLEIQAGEYLINHKGGNSYAY